VLLGVVVAASATGLWRAAEPPTEPLLAPGAFDVHVADVSLERREVNYQVAEPSSNWRAVVEQRLLERGWTLADTDVFVAPQTSYIRTTAFGVGSLLEVAVLAGGSREAHITVIRRIYWSWPQLVAP
jgi:hypothetical protein